MSVPYDVFTDAFLNKITEFEFINLDPVDRTDIVDGFMKRAVSAFRKNCKFDLVSTQDDVNRIFDVDIPDRDVYEIVDIVSEGMLVQWLKPYLYRQELIESVLNTRDFTTYSPAELLLRVGNAYEKVQNDYTQMIREYSFNKGDLRGLHI